MISSTDNDFEFTTTHPLPGFDLDDENSFIKKIDWNDYKKLKKNKNISEGMIPKLENCFYSMKNGVKHVRIGNNEIFSKKKHFTELKI